MRRAGGGCRRGEGEAWGDGRLSVCGGPVASERGLQRPRVVWGVSVDGHSPGSSVVLGEKESACTEADHGRGRWQSGGCWGPVAFVMFGCLAWCFCVAEAVDKGSMAVES